MFFHFKSNDIWNSEKTYLFSTAIEQYIKYRKCSEYINQLQKLKNSINIDIGYFIILENKKLLKKNKSVKIIRKKTKKENDKVENNLTNIEKRKNSFKIPFNYISEKNIFDNSNNVSYQNINKKKYLIKIQEIIL